MKTSKSILFFFIVTGLSACRPDSYFLISVDDKESQNSRFSEPSAVYNTNTDATELEMFTSDKQALRICFPGKDTGCKSACDGIEALYINKYKHAFVNRPKDTALHFEIDIKTYGNVSKHVSGNFSGRLMNETQHDSIVNIEGDFHLKRLPDK